MKVSEQFALTSSVHAQVNLLGWFFQAIIDAQEYAIGSVIAEVGGMFIEIGLLSFV
ncbi:hypothetical protein ACF3NG_00900 [Aerococcaceae bacterium WGS1372]